MMPGCKGADTSNPETYMGFPEVNKGSLRGDSYDSNWGCKRKAVVFGDLRHNLPQAYNLYYGVSSDLGPYNP